MRVFDRTESSTTYFDYIPESDKYVLKTVQDVKPFLDQLKAKRNATQSFGKAEEFAHYCSIPNTVVIELKNKGIDVFNKHQTKELLKEINSNYPWLKATTKHHA